MIVVFILSALRWRRIGLWKLLYGRDWVRGKLGLFFMGGAMLSKSLTQFSVEGWGCVPSLLIDLRPNYGGYNEDSLPPSSWFLIHTRFCLSPLCISDTHGV